MNGRKRPSRKHDWTTTKILVATVCVQVVTLILQLINLIRKFT